MIIIIGGCMIPFDMHQVRLFMRKSTKLIHQRKMYDPRGTKLYA